MARGPAPTEWTFELSGGALCLDFANTLGDRPRGREEHLPDYPALVSFGRQAGLLTGGQASRLLGRAARDPRGSDQALRRAVALRECLYRVFSGLARKRVSAPADLARLNDFVPPALSRLRLRREGTGFAWAWAYDDVGDLERVLWPVARSAAELLVSDQRKPLGECGSETCSWLFIDHSRGGRRRWCNMKTCGNRNKARRHYRRQRRQAGAA